MTLTVRSASVTGAVTAGRALTHAEMDANWAHVIQSANQTFLPSGTGAVAEPVQTTLRRVVWAEQYGFSTTATAAANSTAFTNACNALGSGGGVVNIGLGTFSHNGLSIPSVDGISVLGRGMGATETVLSYTGSGAGISRASQATNGGFYRFENLRLVNAGTGTRGIDMTAMWDSLVNFVYVDSFTANIYMDRSSMGCYDNRIMFCYMNGGSYGVRFANAGSAATNNHHLVFGNFITAPTIAGILVEATTVSGIRIIDNDIESTGSLPRYIDIEGSECTVLANWLDSANAGNTGLYVRGSHNWHASQTFGGTFGTKVDDPIGQNNDCWEPGAALAQANAPFTFNSLLTAATGATINGTQTNTDATRTLVVVARTADAGGLKNGYDVALNSAHVLNLYGDRLGGTTAGGVGLCFYAATAAGWFEAIKYRNVAGVATNGLLSLMPDGGAVALGGAFGCNGATAQSAFASGGAAPAGGTGATAGAYDTAAHRDALITLVNNIRTALVNAGIMS